MQDTLSHIQFIEEFPDIKSLTDPSFHTLIVCHYMVLFKSPRDQTIIHTLARQMFPEWLLYCTCIKMPLKNLTVIYFLTYIHKKDDKYSLRARIFPDEWQMVYVIV